MGNDISQEAAYAIRLTTETFDKKFPNVDSAAERVYVAETVVDHIRRVAELPSERHGSRAQAIRELGEQCREIEKGVQALFSQEENFRLLVDTNQMLRQDRRTAEMNLDNGRLALKEAEAELAEAEKSIARLQQDLARAVNDEPVAPDPEAAGMPQASGQPTPPSTDNEAAAEAGQ